MPMAIPLIAAAAEGIAGYGMMTAASASLASQIAGGVMIAGGAMTAVGTATHNQNLQKWGAVAGLAGGVGGLASGAFSSGTAATFNAAQDSQAANAAMAADAGTQAGATAAGTQAADSAPSVASQVANGGDGFQMNGNTPLADAPGDAPSGPYDAPMNDGPTPPQPSADEMAAQGVQGADRAANGAADAAQAAKDQTAPLTGPDQGGSSAPTSSSYDPSRGVNPPGTTDSVGASSEINSPIDRAGYAVRDAAGGIVDKAKDFGQWIERNPTTAKLGGQIVAGAMSDYAKQKELARQQEYWQKRRDIMNAGNVNVHAPVYVPVRK